MTNPITQTAGGLPDSDFPAIRPARFDPCLDGPFGALAGMVDDVLAGLARPQKAIPAKYLYDDPGSLIFEAICEQPEYYPARTETALLESAAADIAVLASDHLPLVEFGSGASRKTRTLLDAMPQIRRYVPIDISAGALEQARSSLQTDYPDLAVEPLHADFTRLPGRRQVMAGTGALGFFPGSTIGNFTPDEARSLLAGWRRWLGRGSLLLLGVDLHKAPRQLVPAYDDAAGVTAAFNLNLLARLNRELGAGFDVSRFRHRAIWNEEASRVEMHLVSLVPQMVEIAGRVFRFAAGETIHTENSYKHRIEDFQSLAAMAGWETKKGWLSHEPAFAVILFKAA